MQQEDVSNFVCEKDSTGVSRMECSNSELKDGVVASGKQAAGNKICKIAEVTALCVIMAVVWGLFSIPILYYYLPLQKDEQPLNNTTAPYELSNVSASVLDFPCRKNFFREETFNNYCVPSCPEWRQDPVAVSVTIDVVAFLSFGTGVVASVVIFVISAIRYKNMLGFPNALIVYMTAVRFTLCKNTEAIERSISALLYFCIDSFYVITFFDRGKLYCSSENLFMSLYQVTTFCVISGMVQVYCIVAASLWWFMLTAALFWTVWFPLHARYVKTTKKIKIIHMGCALIGVFIPVIPILVFVSRFAVRAKQSRELDFVSGGLGFAPAHFPPLPCLGNDKETLFYAVIFPTNVMLAAGITLTILIFWIIHKKYGIIKEKNSQTPFKITNSERKLLIVLCYYIICTVLPLTAFTDSIRKGDLFQEKLAEYFSCEQAGHDPNNPCDRESFEKIVPSALVILSHVFSGLFPLVNLVFVVNIQDLRNKYQRCTKRIREKSISVIKNTNL